MDMLLGQSFWDGFILQMGLIFGLGAQNIFVLESGLRKHHYLLVAFICSLCDFILILIGVSGFAQFVVQYPRFKFIIGCVGIFFLVLYGIIKLIEGIKGKKSESKKFEYLSKKKIILLCLGFSLLNPHVYLDTIIFIGGISAKYSVFENRILFGLGASFFSCLWFYFLSILASRLTFFFHDPAKMRWISIISGVILIALGYKLSFDVRAWYIW